MKKRFAAVDLNRIRTIPLSRRHSRSTLQGLAKPVSNAGARPFLESLPHHLKADDLRAVIGHIVSARKRGKPVIIMAGGHVIKVGLAPVIIDLMESGFVTGLCLNGAGLIHDAEMALAGKTSEDVAAGIADGTFGMSAETADFFAQTTALSESESIGLGEAAGKLLARRKAPFRHFSLLHACHRLDLPAMVHIAVDTDIVCQHPNYDPAAAATASHHDFKILAHEISRAENGGVFINIGSAVILPEVFLKALTVSRNLHRGRPRKIITANFDMIYHYRPLTNVVERPTLGGGAGYNFVGHHELMIPLLAWGLKAYGQKITHQIRTTTSKRR